MLWGLFMVIRTFYLLCATVLFVGNSLLFSMQQGSHIEGLRIASSPRQLLDRIGLPPYNLTCNACRQLDNHVRNDLRRSSFRCSSCAKTFCFLSSNFSFLYDESHLCSVPSITKEFYDGIFPYLSIGTIISFSFKGVFFQLKQKHRKLTQRHEALVSMLTAHTLPRHEQKKLSLELQNVREQLHSITKDLALRGQLEYNDHSSYVTIDGFTLDDIAIFIKSAEASLQEGKQVLITDDILGDKTVTLFSCWLIYQGWNKEQAIKQASLRRKHGALPLEYLQIIDEYTEETQRLKTLRDIAALRSRLAAAQWFQD